MSRKTTGKSDAAATDLTENDLDAVVGGTAPDRGWTKGLSIGDGTSTATIKHEPIKVEIGIGQSE